MSDTPTGPTVFNDRYELHRKLARGGMADVYLARDLLLDRPVAVKVLFAENAKDETFVERFRREAQAAANLNHPNVVAVYDWGAQYDTYFIVMEYVEGRPLSEIIRSDGPLHPDRAAEITADCAAALAFAHRNGVVHRDVKPGNILITSAGQVKVADFGIAQAGQAGEAAVNLTQAGSVMGTATYFSPEQAQGHAVDPRSDVYSLGCVLYEMLTTRPPFTGDTPVAIAYKHVQEAVIPPTRVNANVPAPLEAITMKALEKAPAGRYASAEDLRADLRRFLEGKPVVALSGAAAAAAGAAAGMAAAGAGADATVAVPATGAGGPVVTPPPTGPVGPVTPGQGTPAYPPPDDKPKRTGLYVAILILLLIVLGAGLFFIGSQLDQPSAEVAVPDVVGLQVAEAVPRIEDEGFRTDIREEASDRPVGEVFQQTPEGNTRAEEGSTVVLRVSSGLGEVEVPDVVGRTRAAAESLLRTEQFVPDVREQPDPDRPAGEVISQNPPGGSMAEKGSVVELLVSSGPPQVTIPDLFNQSSSAASNTLGQLGLQVTTRQESSTSVVAGNVIGTEPPSGTSVPEGSNVTLIVSTGPPPTTTTTTTTAPPPSTTTTAPTTSTTAGG